jgi:hypothetical protein
MIERVLNYFAGDMVIVKAIPFKFNISLISYVLQELFPFKVGKMAAFM